MYRTSKIYKVKSKGGSYKTKGDYYSFSRSDGYVIIFNIGTDYKGDPAVGKYWSMKGTKAKKFFKMIGFGVDPKIFGNIFDEPKFLNEKDRKRETINLYPAKQTIIRNQIEREIQDLKDGKTDRRSSR